MRIPAPLLRFVELFNRGEHWESHEVLEGPWREGRSSFYHGLILFASAYVHRDRGNLHGVDAQMRKALDAFDGTPGAYLGLDVQAIQREARRVRRIVAEERRWRDQEVDEGRDWLERVAPPRLEVDPGRVRGDEPEAAGIRRSRW